MSIRSKMKFGGGLPVGGRSSGGRPKKKVKAKLKKSRARKSAERKLKVEKEYRKDIHKDITNEFQQNRARTPGRVKKAEMHRARKMEARARGYGREGHKDLEKSAMEHAKSYRRGVQKSAKKGNLGSTRDAPSVREYLKQKDRNIGMQLSNKSVGKARKKLASTPRFGGKGRFRSSGSNRNMFLEDVNPAKH